MPEQKVVVEILGASVQCASCVNAPSSIDTYEWLEAAISRKYPEYPFTISYIDIEKPIDDTRHLEWADKINADELFYPLVLINNVVAGEGFIQLPPIFKTLESFGFTTTNK